MRAKLGFALSLAIKFDCILIDEVLSVGDVSFREKASRALAELRSRTSFIMVTHDLTEILKNCDRVILLGGREPIVTDDVKGAVNAYYAKQIASGRQSQPGRPTFGG
jgi:capsular polysaccharide transport system ATP-binding protein